jgi:hypothetical protein
VRCSRASIRRSPATACSGRAASDRMQPRASAALVNAQHELAFRKDEGKDPSATQSRPDGERRSDACGRPARPARRLCFDAADLPQNGLASFQPSLMQLLLAGRYG